MRPYYPVYLDLRARLCVVVGGGEVAERKVSGLVECGARVRVVSPEATPRLREWARDGTVTWEPRHYQQGDLEGAFLAIAATDAPQVNEAIARQAEAQGILLNVVDITRLCNFIAPSVIRRGGVTLAISTGGLSPALARKLRHELERSRALQYADLAEMISRVRTLLREQGLAVKPEHWQASLSDEVLELFQAGRKEEAQQQLFTSLAQAALPVR
ncbi:MAG: bifunctional precorrin-2 dehydrogenase/sirohydrochlorin ferrochelatase [Chloroflexi bacterium]|nr:bifunctional precorrin-2 dehydrogenase/sirohydrochlorin ferrochelatase [Chloroflexota bacterium]